jgi:hypothetical protein
VIPILLDILYNPAIPSGLFLLATHPGFKRQHFNHESDGVSKKHKISTHPTLSNIERVLPLQVISKKSKKCRLANLLPIVNKR